MLRMERRAATAALLSFAPSVQSPKRVAISEIARRAGTKAARMPRNQKTLLTTGGRKPRSCTKEAIATP